MKASNEIVEMLRTGVRATRNRMPKPEKMQQAVDHMAKLLRDEMPEARVKIRTQWDLYWLTQRVLASEDPETKRKLWDRYSEEELHDSHIGTAFRKACKLEGITLP